MFKMTPNILKNFITEKATRLYPYEVKEPYDINRGELVNEIEKCNFCGICAAKCPSQCITVNKKTATWECALFVCVYCGVCVETCPQKCLHQKQTYRKPVREKEIIFMQGEVKAKDTPDGSESS
ncbi:MAG: 4Fe-4S ferredoxin [Desulfobacteraceae bacterium]|nr:4Fe-4S ferredoxin [Desulfobacteraceae bacterium]MBC2756104.1 4Fe-4S ferredoxin [Desulfobacteraceae bacterium]MBC2763739.1 4Fe-4S ferredoxin [ANME-2 cluster archaeon]